MAVLATMWAVAGVCISIICLLRGPSDWALEREMTDHPFVLSAYLVAFTALVIACSLRMGLASGALADTPATREAREKLTPLHVCETALLYLLFVAGVWVLGAFHRMLYWADGPTWLDQATMGHPFLTAAIGLTLGAGITHLESATARDASGGPAVRDDVHADPFDQARAAMSGPRPDPVTALGMLEAAHAAGDMRATHALAGWFLQGMAGPADAGAGAGLMRMASDAGMPGATFDLAVIHERGDGMPRDSAEAYQLYLAAALAGDPRAGREVARCLEFGIGVAPDARAAATWRASSRGAPGASCPWLG